MAVRVPDATALQIIQRGTDRIVEVSDDEIAGAIRILYTATHSCAEGAGAAALAGLIRERERLGGRRAAVILSGQNIDRGWMQTVLAGGRRDFALKSGQWVCAVKRRRFPWCKSHPATAPAGSNRSSYGGDEIAEAFGKRVTKYGDNARV